MAEKRAIAANDWSCAMTDEIGRVAFGMNSTEGDTTYVLMTIFQAAKMVQDLRSPKTTARHDMWPGQPQGS
jgi:hypothetical protein